MPRAPDRRRQTGCLREAIRLPARPPRLRGDAIGGGPWGVANQAAGDAVGSRTRPSGEASGRSGRGRIPVAERQQRQGQGELHGGLHVFRPRGPGGGPASVGHGRRFRRAGPSRRRLHRAGDAARSPTDDGGRACGRSARTSADARASRGPGGHGRGRRRGAEGHRRRSSRVVLGRGGSIRLRARLRDVRREWTVPRGGRIRVRPGVLGRVRRGGAADIDCCSAGPEDRPSPRGTARSDRGGSRDGGTGRGCRRTARCALFSPGCDRRSRRNRILHLARPRSGAHRSSSALRGEAGGWTLGVPPIGPSRFGGGARSFRGARQDDIAPRPPLEGDHAHRTNPVD